MSNRILTVDEKIDYYNKAKAMARTIHNPKFVDNHLGRVVNCLSACTSYQKHIDSWGTGTAAWLHDSVEDEGLTRDYLAQEFYPQVADWVMECTKDPLTGDFPRLHSREGYSIKLADRLANITSDYLWLKHPEKITGEYLPTLKGAFKTKQKYRL